MMLMKTMTEMPWPSRITMSAPLAKQPSTTTLAVKVCSCSPEPCKNACAAASPKCQRVSRKTMVRSSTPQRIKYRPAQKKALTSVKIGAIKCHKVKENSATLLFKKRKEDPESAWRALLQLELGSKSQSANLSSKARQNDTEPTHAADESLPHLQLAFGQNHWQPLS